MVFTGMEWVIAGIFIVVLIFGAKKIPELARSMGKASVEFKRGKLEVEQELDEMRKDGGKASKRKLSGSALRKSAKELNIDIEGKTDDELKREIAAKVA